MCLLRDEKLCATKVLNGTQCDFSRVWTTHVQYGYNVQMQARHNYGRNRPLFLATRSTATTDSTSNYQHSIGPIRRGIQRWDSQTATL